MKKIKIGVMGAYRGTSMINYCLTAKNAEVVAICDKWKEGLERQKESLKDFNIAFYDNFEDFIKHDMDAVVLANYANQHAPFAIKAMKAGKHVFSEVLPCQNMKEAVELIETVEQTGKVYAYGENYCYMPAPYEMRKLYRQGKLGEFEYGEGEYIHNCESIWPSISYGDKTHWRNRMYSTFYCTHSLGPIIHITGLRPVSVTGWESVKNERGIRVGRLGAEYGIEMVTLENGGVVRSVHGGLYTNSIWYSIYCSKGHAESAREDAEKGGVEHIYTAIDEYSGKYQLEKRDYDPDIGQNEAAANFGHGGSDFYSMYNFVEKILGNKDADTIDVYEALDMFLPGLFAYRSVLNGGIPMAIPDLRKAEEREKWRNDTMCTDEEAAGDMLIPAYSKGNPEIPDEVYERMLKKWQKDFEANDTYISNKLSLKTAESTEK